MNHAQKTILLVGTIVTAVVGVYPPWLRVEPNQSAQSMGYGLLWSPPFENRSERARLFGFELQVDMGPVTANKIDWSRLLAQWATIAVLTGSGIALAASRQTTSHVPGSKPRESARV